MNSQLLTGLVAALGVLASIAGVGEVRAQEAHEQVAGHGHHHVDFTSGRFHVRVDGPEHPQGDVILVPGLSSSPAVWQGLTDQLKHRYRVHRVHVQGFGGAPAEDNAEGTVSAPVAEDLARYIAEQSLNKPTVIGHSMGGTIAMMLAARHPDSVGRLMVVDMLPFMGVMFGPPGTTAESVAPVADQIYAAQTTGPIEVYREEAAAFIGRMINTEAARPAVLEVVAASDRRVATAAFRELIVTDLRPELASITAPTEIVYVPFRAPDTAESTQAIYEAAFAGLPGAKLTRIDDSAHFVMLDQPEAFHAAVDAFLSAE